MPKKKRVPVLRQKPTQILPKNLLKRATIHFHCLFDEPHFWNNLYSVNLDSHLPKYFFFICFNESPSKMMKNAFYFILKALFVLKIFKFLSWIFEHVEKTAWLERQGQFRNSWLHSLVDKELQHTYCSKSHELKTTRQWNLVSQ